MSRILPTIIVILLGIGAAFALRAQFRSIPATPLRVPAGDMEIAWIHTTTNPQTWERFVTGVMHTRRQVTGLEVDVSRAFLSDTAAVPEVVLSMAGRPGKLRLRWYKLSGDVRNREWVNALALRDPAPIAFMGGGSSDRAIDLANALRERTEWHGPPPLLFITTATANAVYDPVRHQEVNLIEMYPGRTFRGCFTNLAMARAIVDFVWQSEELKPLGRQTARAHVIAWQDDPYSVDLAEQFNSLFQERKDLGQPLHTVLDRVSYGVGTFGDPNPPEREVLDRVIPDLTMNPTERSLLVLPAATQPARRILRAICGDTPLIGKQLVAVTGDGVSFNTIYRDSDLAWPVRELSIPLVLFAHQNPVAWESKQGDGDQFALQPLNSTDDVLQFADMVRVLAEAAFSRPGPCDSNELAERLRSRQPQFFTPDGERKPGEGEHVIVVRPEFMDGGRVGREATFEIFSRRETKWELVRRLKK